MGNLEGRAQAADRRGTHPLRPRVPRDVGGPHVHVFPGVERIGPWEIAFEHSSSSTPTVTSGGSPLWGCRPRTACSGSDCDPGPCRTNLDFDATPVDSNGMRSAEWSAPSDRLCILAGRAEGMALGGKLVIDAVAHALDSSPESATATATRAAL